MKQPMKHLCSARLALVATLALFSGFALAQGDDAEALEIVNGVVQQYNEAVNQQDAAAFGQLFTENALFLEFNRPTHEGREAIVEAFGFAPENVGAFELSAEATEAMSFGDMVHGLGIFEVVGAEGQVLDEGKWMALYKQEDGALQIYRIITNSNLPLTENTVSGDTMTGGGN